MVYKWIRWYKKRASADELAEWHHRCNGLELGQTLGDGEGQGGRACCSPWDCRVRQLWVTTTIGGETSIRHSLSVIFAHVSFKLYHNHFFSLIIKPLRIVQFSLSVMSDSLWPHGLQHARLLYPSPTLGACSNSCPLSRWCHPTISLFPSSPAFSLSQHQVFF